MKVKFIYIITAIAAVVALNSCAKAISGEEPGTAAVESGERVITASFGPATKSYLADGKFTPKFSDGDRILISNGTEKESCRIYVIDDNAVFYTRMTGTLTAVYPVEAAVLSGNEITGVTVPSSQTGLFKDANIAMAENITTEAEFKNKTSILVFYVDEKIEVKYITVTGTSAVASGGATTITVDSDDALISSKTADNPDPRLCYVSILPSSNTLTFSSETTSQGTVTKTTPTTTFAINTIYKAFIPYYIKVKIQESPAVYQRWGYCNVGAFLPEETGLFFSWADTEGHKRATSNSFENSYTFTKDNARYYVSTSYGFDEYNKYTGTGDGKDGLTVLEPSDDAAAFIWGEGWRMPTAGSTYEYNALKSGTYWGYDQNKGYYVFEISDAGGGTAGSYGDVGSLDKSRAKLFFPTTGRSQDTYGGYAYSSHGFYWSSSLGGTSSNHEARCLHFETAPEITTMNRYIGMTVRPIADESIEGSLGDYDGDLLNTLPKGALPGRFTVNASGGKVFFSKGNLYWDGDSYEFEANQYDFRHYTGITDECAVINGFRTNTPNGTVGSFYFVTDTDYTNKPYSKLYGTTSTSADDVLFTNATLSTPNPGFCVFGVTGSYRALSPDEFTYLTQTRTGNRFAYARYKDVPGMLIFPDGYTLPSGYDSNGGTGMSTVNDFYNDIYLASCFPDGNISASVWEGMQSAGVVFLPAGGYRYFTTTSPTAYYYSGDNLYYWLSKSSGSSQAWSIWGNKTNDQLPYDRSKGLAIRLVADVE